MNDFISRFGFSLDNSGRSPDDALVQSCESQQWKSKKCFLKQWITSVSRFLLIKLKRDDGSKLRISAMTVAEVTLEQWIAIQFRLLMTNFGRRVENIIISTTTTTTCWIIFVTIDGHVILSFREFTLGAASSMPSIFQRTADSANAGFQFNFHYFEIKRGRHVCSKLCIPRLTNCLFAVKKINRKSQSYVIQIETMRVSHAANCWTSSNRTRYPWNGRQPLVNTASAKSNTVDRVLNGIHSSIKSQASVVSNMRISTFTIESVIVSTVYRYWISDIRESSWITRC